MSQAPATFSELLRSLSEPRFLQVVGLSPRQAKETYFARHNIRAPKTQGLMLNPGAKTEARLRSLHGVFQHGEDDTLAEEILRRFLLAHRRMLAAILDKLDIEHDNGLTDSEELSRVGQLDKKAREALIALVTSSGEATLEDAQLYFDFMALQARQAA